MLDKIIATLPADLQEEIAVRIQAHGPVLQPTEPPRADARLHRLSELHSMSPLELVDTRGRWTAYSGYISTLIVVTTIVSKIIEEFLATHEAKLRKAARATSANISKGELTDMVLLDSTACTLRRALQSLAEVKAVLDQRERTCRAAADAASRAITARQVDVQQNRLEARR